jgi:hypothetical protein
MANVNAAVEDIAPLGGTNNKGYRIGYLNSATKAAQNDTVTITNAKVVEFAGVSIDATGASETNTVATNVITLTSATTGSVSGFVYYLAF